MHLTEQLVETVTHPKFLSRVQYIQKATSIDEQWTLIGKTDIAALQSDGISIPKGFRVTPRTFEKPLFALSNGVQEAGLEPGVQMGEVNPETYDWSSFPAPLSEQPTNLNTPEAIAKHITAAMGEIADFVTQAPFIAMLASMHQVVPSLRSAFVLNVVLDSEQRCKLGINIPPNITIQRSTFHDGRPTLFCVSATTPLIYPWKKVTVTFDNNLLALDS